MPEKYLREVLEELRAELDRSEAIDPETRALLHAARGDIEDALTEDLPGAQQRASTARTRIGQAIERFRGEHPEAAELLHRVLHALSDVGI